MTKRKQILLIGLASIGILGAGGIVAVNNSCDMYAKEIEDISYPESSCISRSCSYKDLSFLETKYALTDSEVYTLAALVYLEAGIESIECQRDVASVVINRMTLENKSLNDIIYEENQFEPAYMITETEPSDESVAAVKYVLEYGVTLPEYVTFFRAGYYHQWGDLIDYCQYDNTYFSYSEMVKSQTEEVNP